MENKKKIGILVGIIALGIAIVVGVYGINKKTNNIETQKKDTIAQPINIEEKAATDVQAVQEKVKEGALTAEEAKEQMDAIGSKIPLPPMPDNLK